MGKIKSKENLIRLVEQYKNLVFSLCLKLTGDYFISEDITQETFISVYEHWDSFDGDSEKAWVCRIASNKCIDYLRDKNRKALASFEEGEEEQIPDCESEPLNQVLCKEVLETLLVACEELKEPYNKVSKMYFADGLKAREISEKLGIPLKTIQTQILRSKELLKKKIRREDLLQ